MPRLKVFVRPQPDNICTYVPKERFRPNVFVRDFYLNSEKYSLKKSEKRKEELNSIRNYSLRTPKNHNLPINAKLFVIPIRAKDIIAEEELFIVDKDYIHS